MNKGTEPPVLKTTPFQLANTIAMLLSLTEYSSARCVSHHTVTQSLLSEIITRATCVMCQPRRISRERHGTPEQKEKTEMLCKIVANIAGADTKSNRDG